MTDERRRALRQFLQIAHDATWAHAPDRIAVLSAQKTVAVEAIRGLGSDPDALTREHLSFMMPSLFLWLREEGIHATAHVGVGTRSIGDAPPYAAIVVEFRDEFSFCGPKAARLEQWLSLHGLAIYQYGGDRRLGVSDIARIGVALPEVKPLRAAHLDLDEVLYGIGRTIIEHAERRPRFQKSSREEMHETCRRLLEASGRNGPGLHDWDEWSG